MPKILSHILKLFFSCLLLSSFSVYGQELNCNVIINAEQAQTQEQQVFDELKTAIIDFMNNRSWTEDEYLTEERINCNLLINVTQLTNLTNFTCNAQIQVTRPIYGVDYETPILSIVDKDFNFTFNDGQLIFNENIFTTNLTSLLAFYAYVILAVDYDTFSPQGGSQYITKALNIVNNAQGASFRGWKQFEGPNNRYNLIDQMNSAQFIPFRVGLYKYHRLALDKFEKDPEKAREIILSTFDDIRQIRSLQPISFLLESYFLAKASEFVDIFSIGDALGREKAFDSLRRIDPTNTQRYEKIVTDN